MGLMTMPAQGVNVYLDPYEKTELEGHALCVQRIANIPESTHHGVTCQRWHVRFQEDQDNTARWVDAGDFIDWVPPAWNVSCFQFQLPSATFSEGVGSHPFWTGDVQLSQAWVGDGPHLVIPCNGRLRGVSLYSHTSGKAGTPGPVTTPVFVNASLDWNFTIPDAQTVCVHSFNATYPIDGVPVAKGDKVTIRAQCTCDGAETLTLQNLILILMFQWGNFT